ncbi:MAG: HAMP domain-containing protein [Nitrospirae bacterium]|nr:HAMP domain-containing protein [Nitrospirota bacterium]
MASDLKKVLPGRTMTFRKKILLVAVSGLISASFVYTFEAVRTERSIMRSEIIKKAEVVTELASRLGELPLISGNPELMKKAITSLKNVSEVSFIAFYDKDMTLLEKEGEVPPQLHKQYGSLKTSILEDKNYFDLCTPVFTVRSGEDIDIFSETDKDLETKESVGWVRIGFSKASMNEASSRIIYRGLVLAVLFTVISIIFIYKLFTVAVKPLTLLSKAVQSVRSGRYPEIPVSSADELGMLTAEFNRMSRAISEREEMLTASLEEKEVLLKEIHHRVKNNMQVISSLLSLQSGQVGDKRYAEILNESRNRIRSMALVHEKLYRSPDLASIDFNDYIKSLSSTLLSFYDRHGSISLKTDAADVNLAVDTAIPCGLIITELVSNCLKHAFPDGRSGEVLVSFKKTAENDRGNEYELIIRDNGVGIPEDLDIRKTNSLGLQLVTSLVEHQLQGRLELARSAGTGFCIRFKELRYKKMV